MDVQLTASMEGYVSEENKNDVDAHKGVYGNQKGLRRKKLLQFDKTLRPGCGPRKGIFTSCL